MKNFKITAKEDNKEYWISRAVAVVAAIYAVVDGKKVYLLERRGPGCPDNIGKLCFPCGYLDWDEGLIDAVIREVREELGINLLEVPSFRIKFWKIVDNPKSDPRQNVVIRYRIILSYDDLCRIHQDIQSKFKNSEERGGEKDEVSEVLLLTEQEVNNLYKDDDFAFNHRRLISELSNPTLS